MLSNIKAVILILLLPVVFTVLSVWLCPILWVQGSSAAFNFGGFLCIMSIASWWFAFWILKGLYQGKK